jgi:hypothetical protein
LKRQLSFRFTESPSPFVMMTAMVFLMFAMMFLFVADLHDLPVFRVGKSAARRGVGNQTQRKRDQNDRNDFFHSSEVT